MKRIVEFCSQFGERPRAAGKKAFVEWEQRHQAYLEENARVKKELLDIMKMAEVTPEQKQLINQMFAVSIPKMIDVQTAAYTAPIDSLPDVRMKASLCVDYAQSVADGHWDLKKNDPIVAKFLDDRLDRKGK